MKLILTQEVTGLGAPGDVVDVKDGYARNFLLPRSLATPWTKGGEKQVATIKRARDARNVRDLGQAQEIKRELEGRTYTLPARAGAGGRLFGSVTAADVVSAVQRAGGPQLDRRRLQLAGSIKSLGRHEVPVVLHPEVTATIPLEVVSA